MRTVWDFHNIENKHTLYRGEDCMKKFSASLKEHATNIINFEKKKMLPLTKEDKKLHQEAKVCYISGEKLLKSLLMITIIKNLGTIVILQVTVEAQHIIFVI